MFTVEQIKASHSKVKSGADFPSYVQEIIQLGVTHYVAYVEDGNVDYFGKDNYKISSGRKYEKLNVADKSDKAQFEADLKAHQQGKTTYPTFCTDCAKSGIEKWEVCMEKMTCTYFDKAGKIVLAEMIPVA